MVKIKNKKINLGIILIVVGIIWILSNLNLININLYNMINQIIRGIFDLWPLILIVIGINVIFKKELLNSILWLVFLIVLLVYSFFTKDDIFKTPYNGNSEEIYTPEMLEEIEMRNDIERAKLYLDVGATNFNIVSVEDELLSLDHDGDFKYSFDSRGSTESIYISNKSNIFKNADKRNFELGLNKNIPWNLDIDIGAVAGKINLEDIDIGKIDLDIGAGSVELTLGDKAKLTSIDIDAGASQIVVNVPKNSGVRISIDGALKSTNLDEVGLIKTDKNNYVSGNFNSVSSKYEIEVDIGVGEFTLNYY